MAGADVITTLAASSAHGPDIGWFGLVASLLMVAVAIGLSLARQLHLERSIAWAATRAGAQLLAVGAVLGVLLDPGRPVAWAFAWVVVMLLVAAYTVDRRVPEVPGVGWLALLATTAAASVGLGVLFGLGVFPLEGRALVPLAGLLIGNALTSTVVVVRRIVAEVADKRAEIEARLALGQPWPDASRPYVRSALRTALLPAIERTKIVGLVALPGAMTGLILAGVDPVDAVKIQAAVMFLILGGEAVTVSVVALGLTRRLFTPDHRLLPLARAKT